MGFFSEEVVDAYKEEDGDYYHRDTVDYYIPIKDTCDFPGPFGSYFCGDNAVLSPSATGTFLYMDVGRWGGNGDGGWPKSRDFGLVCGATAALCTYQGCYLPETELLQFLDYSLIRSYYGGDEIMNLVGHLSSGPLGKVMVRKILCCDAFQYDQTEANTYTVYVFLGDLHFPVMTKYGRTDKPIVDNTTVSPLVRRYARVDPNDSSITTPNLKKWRKWPGEMSMSLARNWFHHYHGTSRNIGADIFEQAGKDLIKWIDLLESFYDSDVKLIQTGDMFDYWIGLTRYFKKSSTVAYKDEATKELARKFVKHWTEETLVHTSEGPAVQRLLDTSYTLDTEFLYGNHDNYLRNISVGVEIPKKGSDPYEIDFEEVEVGQLRSGMNNEDGLYVEHGHNGDDSNRDGATSGWKMTQLAFLYPGVRSLEPSAREIIRKWSGLFGDGRTQRLKYMARAADSCNYAAGNLNNKWCIYVMGHTHHGFLRQVSLVPQVLRSY